MLTPLLTIIPLFCTIVGGIAELPPDFRAALLVLTVSRVFTRRISVRWLVGLAGCLDCR